MPFTKTQLDVGTAAGVEMRNTRVQSAQGHRENTTSTIRWWLIRVHANRRW